MSTNCSFLAQVSEPALSGTSSPPGCGPKLVQNWNSCRSVPAYVWLPYWSGSEIRTNPYKSDHFHECEFSTPVIPTTYNFNAVKCTDFSGAARSTPRLLRSCPPYQISLTPQNRQNRRTRRFLTDSITLYQPLTTNQNRRTPIFSRPFITAPCLTP